MKRIVVLGSNGQLGKTLKSVIKKDSNQYIFYSRQELDITDKETLKSVFLDHNFDFCINCAAYTNVEEAERDTNKAFLINANGVNNIAKVCSTYNVKLIHVSTDYVFDGKKTSPYKTNDVPNPLNQYGKSKLLGEQNIKAILKEHYIIRSSWLYSMYGNNFLKMIVKKIEEGKSISITTEEKGTPTSCLDLSEFILFLTNHDNIPYGTYNFSARGSTTWYGFANEIAKHFCNDKNELIKPIDSYKTIAKRPKYSVLDISKTEKLYMNLEEWQKSVENLVEKVKNTNSY